MISRRQFPVVPSAVSCALGVSTAAYGVRHRAGAAAARHALRSTPPQWPEDFRSRSPSIADIHACDPWMSLEHIEAIVERTNALNADIIVMLGDYVAGHRQVTRIIPADEWAAVLAGLKAPLGVHADPRQSRLVARQVRAARRARADGRAPRARSRRHSGLRKRRGAPEQGRPAVLARRSRRSAGLLPARRFRPVRRIGVDDLARRWRRSPTTRR